MKPYKSTGLLIVFFAIFELHAGGGFPDQGFRRPEILGDVNTSAYYISPCRYIGDSIFPMQPNKHIYDNGQWYEIINTHSKDIDPCQHQGLHFNEDNNYQIFSVKNPILDSWAVSANFEPVFLDGLSMPNQSLPIETSTSPIGAFGLKIGDASHQNKRLFLTVNSRYKVKGHLGLPFLGVGVFADKNNNRKPLGNLSINESMANNDKLKFLFSDVQSEILELDNQMVKPDIKQYSGLQLFLFSHWKGENRMISIALSYGNGIKDLGINTWVTKKWNWPINGSYYDGGAELVYTTGNALKAICHMEAGFPSDYVLNAPKNDQNFIPLSYHLDISKIYHCLSKQGAFSETMPITAPLTGVLWAVEATASTQKGKIYGDSLTVALEKMRLD